MPISNEEYIEYEKKIAERDKDSLAKVFEELKVLQSNSAESLENIENLRKELPPLSATTTGSRSNIENLYMQVQSFVNQLSYLKNSYEVALNPPQAMPVT